MAHPITVHIRSNIVGYVAVFLALSGVAYAVGLPPNSVRSKQIKNGQVKNRDVAVGAVTADKVGAETLTGGQINESTLGQVPSAQDADHAAVADHAVSAETAGNADQLGGLAPTAFQQRVSGVCSGAQSIQSIGADGLVKCGSPAGSGTVTSVGSGTGLSGGPITGSGTLAVAPSYRLPQSCANGQVAKSNGAGVWNCAADTDTNTTYSAGANGGLALSGTAFRLTNCASGQILRSTGTNTWACAAENDGVSAYAANVATSTEVASSSTVISKQLPAGSYAIDVTATIQVIYEPGSTPNPATIRCDLGTPGTPSFGGDRFNIAMAPNLVGGHYGVYLASANEIITLPAAATVSWVCSNETVTDASAYLRRLTAIKLSSLG